MMGRSYFVTGTDTGVGKTLVASALIHLHAARGARAGGSARGGVPLRSASAPCPSESAGARVMAAGV